VLFDFFACLFMVCKVFQLINIFWGVMSMCLFYNFEVSLLVWFCACFSFILRSCWLEMEIVHRYGLVFGNGNGTEIRSC